MGTSSITQIGSFMVYSIDENGDAKFLGTLDGIESIKANVKEKPENENESGMIFSLYEPDEATFTAKMTFWTRIRLWLWWRKYKIHEWLIFRKFKRSFDKAAKVQAKHEKVLKRGN